MPAPPPTSATDSARTSVPDAGRRTLPSAQARPALRLGLVLLDKFTLAAFSGLVDAVRLAADHGGGSRPIHASWTVMSLGGKPRRSSSGVLVEPDADLLAPDRFDYVAVCGGNDYLNTALPAALLDYLKEAAAARVRLLGICTGTFALAQAGLVGTRSVCVHWNVLDAFAAQFPAVDAVVDRLFIDEGDLITCAGSTAAIDLGLYLVGRHCGPDKAQQALRHMMLHDIRPPAMPQAHFYARLGSGIDLRVRQAALFIEQRLDAPPSIGAVARYVGISERQLDRLFLKAFGIGPGAFHRRMRLDYADWLLINTRRSITQIAHAAGFADAAHLSRDFRSGKGITPTSHRKASSPR